MCLKHSYLPHTLIRTITFNKSVHNRKDPSGWVCDCLILANYLGIQKCCFKLIAYLYQNVNIRNFTHFVVDIKFFIYIAYCLEEITNFAYKTSLKSVFFVHRLITQMLIMSTLPETWSMNGSLLMMKHLSYIIKRRTSWCSRTTAPQKCFSKRWIHRNIVYSAVLGFMC